MAEDIKVVPKGWRRVRLGEIAKVVSGFGFPTKYQGRDSGDYPFIKVEDLNRASKYIISADNYIDKATVDLLKAKIFPPRTIIFPKIGMALYHNKYRILKVFGTFDNNIAGIILTKGSSEFLYYYFLWTVDLKRIAGETAVPSVKKSSLELIPIIFPPLPEQRKIAEILETVDNAIEKTDRIIEKYKRIKQGLMQDLLTRGIVESDELGVMSYELRDEKKHRFKDSLLGRIPEEWEVVELGCVGDIIYGEGLRQELYEPDGDTLVFGTGGIIGRAKLFLDRGPALVIPRKGSITSVFYIQEDQKFWIIDTAFYLKPQNGYCKFIYFTLCNMDLELLNEATGVPSLSRENIKSIQIPLPPLPEQHRIASLLSQIDEAIEKEQKYKEKLERIKKGLMEDLLMGKVRVNHLIGENKSLERVENV